MNGELWVLRYSALTAEAIRRLTDLGLKAQPGGKGKAKRP